MRTTRRSAGLTLALGAAIVAAACGGSADAPASSFSGVADLQGRSIAVASVSGAASLQARYVLQERYGLSTGTQGGDVTLVESTQDALPGLLLDGEVDAIVLSQSGAYQAEQSEDMAVLANVTEEMRELTGMPVLSTVLITYPDVAQQRQVELLELNRMLSESATYFQANRSGIIEEVAREQAADQEFLTWWWDRHDLAFGAMDAGVLEQLSAVWDAATLLGDIESSPDAGAASFMLPPTTQITRLDQEGVKTTVSLAVLDDPARRAALYAIDQGVVTSNAIDLDITYLSQTKLSEAAPAKQYSAIEASPLIVAQGQATGVEFRVLSAALQDIDGTLLFVRGRD